MYVLYNIHEIVLLIKIMRKLYQILYNVGRLTYAPGGGLFPFGGTLGQWAFPFPGTSLFCAVVCGSVLANACMLLYWPCTAVPMVCAGRKAVCAADLFLVVVVLLA